MSDYILLQKQYGGREVVFEADSLAEVAELAQLQAGVRADGGEPDGDS